MLYVVMPSGKDFDISYRMKCVVVESERLFGDVVITRQTRDQPCWMDSSSYPNWSRHNVANLKKKTIEVPDFMALNKKPKNHVLGSGVINILPLADTEKNSLWKYAAGTNEKYIDSIDLEKKRRSYPLPMLRESVSQELVVTSLVDQLLLDIYGYPRSEKGRSESDSTASSYKPPPQHRYLRRARLLRKSKGELTVVVETLRQHVNHTGGLLIRQLRRRDYLVAKRDKQYDVITAYLQAHSSKRSEDTRMRFSLTPQPGESGFTQWLDAMKMVARLQGGMPQEFRKRLWLTLAERHLDQRGVDWKQAEKLCFNEWSNPDDEELGIQIVKDLHRTGCSLFCGAAGRDNQAVLRRVLLGFARWNKSVGYCQGLNVLAALVLQVTDRAESSAVKVMIYLIEGVLPEGYFADNLRGLSIDMAVFRDLLRMRLPKLSRHLEALQCDAKDKATGSSYEPPLTNVFTMQWFLTLFCHCLPQEAVLRVWDLIFLEGDEVLLRTALAIWEGISDRIMTVTSADEFYSIMGVLTREMLEFTDVNNLIKTIVNMGPLYGVTDLREKHRYNITPWARRLSDDEDTDTEEEERLAVAAAMFGVPQRFKKDRSNASSSALQTIGPTSDRERLALDISTLKHQYAKLRERQRQAHIILSAACARQSMVTSSTSQAMNHLLVGKSALVSVKTRQLGPPPGAIPPKPRATATPNAARLQGGRRDKHGVTLHWKDAKKSKDESDVRDEIESSSNAVSTPEMMSSTLTSPKRSNANDSDSDSTSTELCDEPDRLSDVDSEEPTSTSDCYVMATDDEKSPRPGASPITGSTTLHQHLDKNNTIVKLDTTYLDVGGCGNDANTNSRQLSEVGETSASIAMITDQIRRLSASEDHDSALIDHPVTKDLKRNKSENESDGGNDNLILRNDKFCELESVEGKRNMPSIIAKNDDVGQDDSSVSKNTFETLDRYDFLISSDESGITDKLSSPVIALVDKYREIGVEEVSAVANDNNASSLDRITDLFKIPPSSNDERTPMEKTPQLNDNIVNYQSIKPEVQEMTRLKSTDPLVSDCAKYEDSSERIVTTMRDQSEKNMNDLTYCSRSYVIGHLPISPATVNEKLSRIAEISSATENLRISSTDIGPFDSDTSKSDETSFGSIGNIGTSNPTDTSKFAKHDRLDNDVEARPSYEPSKCTEPSVTYGRSMSIDQRITDTLARFDTIKKSNDNADFTDRSKDAPENFTTDSEIVEAVCSDASLVERSTNNVDQIVSLNDKLGRTVDAISTKSSNTHGFGGKVNWTRDEESVTHPSPSVNETSSSNSSSNYVYQDSQSTKFPEEKKKSPKTPESGKSFSSGETMGPDSRNSSLTTSPRSGTADSRTLPLSERSSLTSNSKTLTLRSMESEAFVNDVTKLNARSDVTRLSLDKSSPSTPISTDSLKNKSEISPKFVISSSSESCSPGKANKSSERSFSSELQSPVSANSIKFRTSYIEGQDNLSESPMDICSATSPFYPIVNPNQKTRSPYGIGGKQSANSNSDETSPEQKSTSGQKPINPSINESVVSLGITRSNEIGKVTKTNDEYDSGRPFEKELAETLSSLPCDRTNNERTTTFRRYNEDNEITRYRRKKTTINEIDEIEERNIEIDIVSPLPGDRYEASGSMYLDKGATFKSLVTNEPDENAYTLTPRGNSKPFERSCSSLDKRFNNKKTSPTSEELLVDAQKKRSSDILQDIKHLEEKKLNDGKTNTSMLTRKTGYVWEDLKNLEARRQDNFSDSASEFLRDRLDPPCINFFDNTRIPYDAEAKVNIDEESDSILKSYARKQSNGETDDDTESKLGVWTKVKPRSGRESGRRSSDRALKIIQENSVILHKILTCQAKKRMPDLEEISKEITISPINEEISKIFSPILEKMGLNEHEISEELARINFKDFDQMTTASGSEFDAKINDELSKLSLIDDTEIVDPMAVDDVVSGDYLDTREALIDRQINEELSKLLANYEEESPICAIGNRDENSSCKNPSDIEPLDISSISNNVFSYPSSNDSIEMKSDLDSSQEATLGVEHFAQYGDETMIKYGKSSKYRLRGVSPTSDIDIYRELEKLDKISSGEILPSSTAIVSQKIISPISYASECLQYPEVRPSTPEYSAKTEITFERSPMRSPYEGYTTYEFKSRISPRKTPSNPYSARSYEKSTIDDHFEFRDDPTTPSRLYDLGGNTRPVLSKETLEFRVRYDDEDENVTSKVLRDDDLSLEPYQTSLVNFDRGASYYSNEPSVSLKRLEAEINLEKTMISPINCSYSQSDLYARDYEPISPKNYSYSKNTTDYEKTYNIDEENIDDVSYLSHRRKNSHSLSPNYRTYDEREFGGSTSHQYVRELTKSLDEASKRTITHPVMSEKNSQLVKYQETTSTREAMNFRKASLSLGPLDGTSSRTGTCHETTPSPKSSLFSPFPVRNTSRKPKELGLKLGLYSPSSPAGSHPLKRS